MIIRLIFLLFLAANAAHARNCKFSIMCIDGETCENVDFGVSIEHTGKDEQGQTAQMRLPALPWIPIYVYNEAYVVNGRLYDAEVGSRHYYFAGIGTGIMLTTISGKAILTIHGVNARPEPPFIMVRTYLGSCG